MNSRSTIPPPIDFEALNGDITAGRRVVIVTPNRRLAAYLTNQFDAAQHRAGRRAWQCADILPLDTFLERSFRTLCSRATGCSLPMLLTASQSQFHWEELVRKSDADAELLNVPQAAHQAFAAWQLAHAWRLLPAMRAAAMHEDAKLFLSWVRRHEQVCREGNLIDGATLADFLATQLSSSNLALLAWWPQEVYAAGFDLMTPQRQQFLDACAAAGAQVKTVASCGKADCVKPTRVEFANEADEIRACAAWARQRLESNPASRIAIVVPDLKTARAHVSRALIDALSPLERCHVRSHHDDIAPLFNISLGQPLSEYPLVHDALELIEFSQARAIAYTRVSAILRSPYIVGARDEAAPRARLDVELRKRVAPDVGLISLQKRLSVAAKSGAPTSLARALVPCEKWLHAIDKVIALGPTPPRVNADGGAMGSSASPETWSLHFAAVLKRWGFPGEPGLDSIEFQVMNKFREALDNLASLRAVKLRLRAGEALAQLRRIVGDTVFQPEHAGSTAPPIQALGILESAGQNFDAIWITGLSDDAWPLTARPAAFIPAACQRAAGVPEASAVASLELDRRITEGWRTCAPDVIFSHARHASGHNADKQIRAASALIADLPLAEALVSPALASIDFAHAAQAVGMLEAIPDPAIEPLPAPTLVHGGANVFRDQAACPFRAFARHRLAAESLALPHAGLDHAERGILMHRVLYLVWGELGSHATLLALDKSAREKCVNSAVAKAIADARADSMENLTGRFAEIEHARLTRAVQQWLAYEAGRAPFEVVEREVKRNVTLAGLSLNLRLDRMDRLADGTHAVIDYKTGTAKFTSWLGTRPDEPQLPLYFATADALISVLAFARVKRGEPGKVFGFEGVSAAEDLLLDVAPIEKKRGMEKAGYVSWDVLTEEWDSSLRALAKGFGNGDAQVDPKHGGLTCAQCDLQSVCRVAERSEYAALDVGTDGDDIISAEGTE